jgi:3-isopropylmalate/(R)-2-methylmalate dehydratase small subunit
MACPDVSSLFEDGDSAEVDYISGNVRNLTRGLCAQGAQLPASLAEIVAEGGVIPMLIAGGYIEPKKFIARST